MWTSDTKTITDEDEIRCNESGLSSFGMSVQERPNEEAISEPRPE